MIGTLFLNNFKNFASEHLDIGPFTLIVGANASGKSNIRDAFRILNGIGCGYTLGEVFGGKYLSGQMVWLPIRGAPNEIFRTGKQSFMVSSWINLGGDRVDFGIIIGSDLVSRHGFRIWDEYLTVNNSKQYEWGPGGFSKNSNQNNELAVQIIRRDQAIITQWETLRESKFGKEVIRIFSEIRFLDLVPDRMREPSIPGQDTLGDSGENLPTVLRNICEDEANRRALVDWIRELTPMDIEDFDFLPDLNGKVNLVFKEPGGHQISAAAASDGTLRFLAMLAALMTPDPPSLYFFEEIDNGIHPSRLRLLVDLIETQTAKQHIQVVATTHSPELLSIVNDETFKHTSIVCRREGTSDAIIRPVSEIPNAIELRKSQGLGRLLAGGWMETALAFAQDDEDGEETPG